jgi:hypothetical protein
MKILLLILFVLLHGILPAQFKKNVSHGQTGKKYKAIEQYFSFNPFALAEPQLAVGIGFGNRFTERSEYFTELSYVGKQPFYDGLEVNYLHGIRFLAQYRYHFLQQWRPLIDLGKVIRERRAEQHPFIAVELRIKPYEFSANGSFVKNSPPDTLNKQLYKAGSFTIGGAVLLGKTFDISANEKWKIEITGGMGIKTKSVHYKNIATGYEPLISRNRNALAAPAINDAVASPYFPFAIRIRYVLD